MKVEGTYTFAAPPDLVWGRLQDPEALRTCIPGCRDLVGDGPDRWKATLSVGAGPIRGVYNGTVAIRDKQEPVSYTLDVEGTGSPGFVRGSARVTLAAAGGGTVVTVDADGQVGGTVAAVGQRMVTGVARMLMGQFFSCLAASL